MNKRGPSLFVLLALSASGAWGDQPASGQPDLAQLDAACEAAREQRLAPEREGLISECVRKHLKETLQECRRFYSDYGAPVYKQRGALYYDMPECVRAFEARRDSQLK